MCMCLYMKIVRKRFEPVWCVAGRQAGRRAVRAVIYRHHIATTLLRAQLEVNTTFCKIIQTIKNPLDCVFSKTAPAATPTRFLIFYLLDSRSFFRLDYCIHSHYSNLLQDENARDDGKFPTKYRVMQGNGPSCFIRNNYYKISSSNTTNVRITEIVIIKCLQLN